MYHVVRGEYRGGHELALFTRYGCAAFVSGFNIIVQDVMRFLADNNFIIEVYKRKTTRKMYQETTTTTMVIIIIYF